MPNYTINNRRIAKNTAYLYIRMLLLMIVNLYTSRVVLHSLGIEDYGIYTAVGGFVSMFSMVSSALTTAISRYITYALGENDNEKLKNIFSTSVIIQSLLALSLVLISETAGIWFLKTKMTIPAEREIAALFVFQFSVISFSVNFLSVPYNAVLIAHEKMSAFAYIGIFEGLANFGVALLLNFAPFDTLVFYSLLMALVSLIVRLIYGIYCKRNFDETRGKLIFDRTQFRSMLGFAGWNFIGVTSGVLRSQGINILFNIYNGPIVNAARGIATQIFNAVNKFSGNFYTAVQPQITKSYAAGKHSEANKLACDSCRLAFYLLLLIGIPILSETNFLLRLWLHEVPEHTSIFIKIIVIFALLESYSQPLIYLMLATGKIRNYQITVGTLCLLNFPVAWLVLHLGHTPETAQATTIIFSFISMIVRVYMLNKMTGLSLQYFFLNTFGRACIVTLISLIAPYIITISFPESSMRFILGSLCSESISIITILLVGLTINERNSIVKKLTHLFKHA